MEERGGMKRIGRKGGQAGCFSGRPEHAALAADSSYFTILAYFVKLKAGCLIRQGALFNGVVREAVPGRLAQAQPGVCVRACVRKRMVRMGGRRFAGLAWTARRSR